MFGRVTSAFLSAIGAIVGAHVLCYLLLYLLPDAANRALGVLAVQPDALEAFRQRQNTGNYFDIILGILLHGNFGRTIDGVPIAGLLGDAILQSIPRLSLAASIILCSIGSCLIFLNKNISSERALAFVAFLPPYLPAFILLPSALFFFQRVPHVVVIIAMSVPTASVATLQVAKVIRQLYSEQFVITYKAYGLSKFHTRKLLAKNLVMAINPSVEKWFVQILTSLMFAEAIFGIPGLGSLTIRAVQQSDVQLVMSIVLVFATWVTLIRLAFWSIRNALLVDER